MSTDRRLEHELVNNPQAEAKRVQELEHAIQEARSVLKQEHKTISSSRHPDLSNHYLQRDQAFFQVLDRTHRLQSKITFLSNYQEPIAIPKVRNSDARIQSVLEKRNPKQTALLLDFKTFIDDQTHHEKEILRLNRWIIDVHDQIKAIVLPRILYTLLVWTPALFRFYQYFFSTNSLDEALKLGESLKAELEDIEKQIQTEDTRYFTKWKDKYAEYYALSMNPRKVTSMLQEYETFENMEKNQQALTEFIQACSNPKLQTAYRKFQQSPCYLNLFHLCTHLCEQQHHLELEHHDSSQCTQALTTLGFLYPEIEAELIKFTQKTLEHLSEKAVFSMLEERLQHSYDTSKEIQEKIKRAQIEFETTSIRVGRLNPKTDAEEITSIRERLLKLDAYVKKGQATLQSRRKYIEPLKHFIQNRTGANLRTLYWVAKEYEDRTADILEKLYPMSIHILKNEQQDIMIPISSETGLKLQEQYYDKLLTIIRSRDPKMSPFKEMAEALKPLLETPNWTSAHFKVIEEAVQKNPQYMQDKTLGALFNQIVTTVAGYQRPVQETIAKTAAPAISAQSAEIIINSSAPTFFHAPTRTESTINALIRNFLGEIQLYTIHSTDKEYTNEEKQTSIQQISPQLLEYIDLLSESSTQQDISHAHKAVLHQMGDFIKKLQNPDLQLQMSTSDLTQVRTLLEQLDPQHPIRKGTEFLISVFQTTDEYLHISTQYAQAELQRGLNEDLRLEKKLEERRAKSKHPHQSNANKWSVVYGILKRIEDYAARLNRFATANHADEQQGVNQLSTSASNLYQKLRYGTTKHAHEIPNLMQQLEQDCDNLKTHPLYSATLRMIDTFKELDEYTSLPQVAEKQVLQAKRK